MIYEQAKSYIESVGYYMCSPCTRDHLRAKLPYKLCDNFHSHTYHSSQISGISLHKRFISTHQMLLRCLRQHVFSLLYRLYYCLYVVRNFDMGEIPSGIVFTLRFAKTSHFIQTLTGGKHGCP